VTTRQFLLLAVIPPAPFLSGGRSSAEGGGESRNQHADVYMFASSFPRVCPLSFLTVWLRVLAVVFLLRRLISPQPWCGVAGCVRFSSRASDFVVGAGSFYLGCIFVVVQVRFLFFRAVSDDDGFVRNVVASSLQRGGSCECSRFCGALRR
jgi:hypothetical protein